MLPFVGEGVLVDAVVGAAVWEEVLLCVMPGRQYCNASQDRHDAAFAQSTMDTTASQHAGHTLYEPTPVQKLTPPLPQYMQFVYEEQTTDDVMTEQLDAHVVLDAWHVACDAPPIAWHALHDAKSEQLGLLDTLTPRQLRGHATAESTQPLTAAQ